MIYNSKKLNLQTYMTLHIEEIKPILYKLFQCVWGEGGGSYNSLQLILWGQHVLDSEIW